MEVIKGDLLESNVDIILHQVNLQGVMGVGLLMVIGIKLKKYLWKIPKTLSYYLSIVEIFNSYK